MRLLLWLVTQMTLGNGGLPQGQPAKKTYSDYLWTAREVEKEDSMELSQSPWNQAIDNTAKPKTTSFFPLWKLKGNQSIPEMATMHLVHLEEGSAKRNEEVESKDPDSINEVTEEFMVHLVRAIKDA